MSNRERDERLDEALANQDLIAYMYAYWDAETIRRAVFDFAGIEDDDDVAAAEGES